MHEHENWAFPSTPCYVVKNDAGQYLQIVSTVSGASADSVKIRWTSRKALASRWVNSDGLQPNVQMWKIDDDGRVVPNGGWCVGLDMAVALMKKHGGHLVHVRRKLVSTHARQAAAICAPAGRQ